MIFSAPRIRFEGDTAFSPRFVRPPVLRWSPVEGVARYQVRVADPSAVVAEWDTTATVAGLAAAWSRLPTGPVDVLVSGHDSAGAEACLRGHRRFWRVPGFNGDEPEPLDWDAALRRNIRYLLAPARDEVKPYENGQPRTCWSAYEDSVTGRRARLAYPALHHPSFIKAFLEFVTAFPDDPHAAEASAQAHQLGRWLLDHRQPGHWVCGGLPYSTIERGSFQGGVEGSAITLFRAARVGEAMLAMFRDSRDQEYLDYARHIADILVKLQREDGSWPYRIDPRTGDVVEEYTSSAITPARLFGLLEEFKPDPELTQARERAVRWVLRGPARDNRWQGMYEDITETSPYENLQNWDTNETIRYLLSRYCDEPNRVEIALRLNDFIEDQFVVWQPEDSPVQVRCPTPAVLEQYRCYSPMEVHTANWLMSLFALHHTTGDRQFFIKATAAANTVVRSQQPSGAFSTWGVDTRFGQPLTTLDWPGCNASATTGLLRWRAYYAARTSGAPYQVELWSL